MSFPRQSVQRYLGQFVERDWVTKDGGMYRLTVPGELVLDEHMRYHETIDRIETSNRDAAEADMNTVTDSKRD